RREPLNSAPGGTLLRREYALVYRAGLLNETRAFKLRLRDKPDDFAHWTLQITGIDNRRICAYMGAHTPLSRTGLGDVRLQLFCGSFCGASRNAALRPVPRASRAACDAVFDSGRAQAARPDDDQCARQ